MGVLRALTPEEIRRAEQRLLHPQPGSHAAAARDYGLDLSLNLPQLRLSPAERAAQMMEVCRRAQDLRGRAVRKQR